MKTQLTLLLFVMSLCLSISATAQVTKKKNAHKLSFIYANEFQKLSVEKKAAYIDALRDAANHFQAKSPSFAQYLMEMVLSTEADAKDGWNPIKAPPTVTNDMYSGSSEAENGGALSGGQIVPGTIGKTVKTTTVPGTGLNANSPGADGLNAGSFTQVQGGNGADNQVSGDGSGNYNYHTFNAGPSDTATTTTTTNQDPTTGAGGLQGLQLNGLGTIANQISKLSVDVSKKIPIRCFYGGFAIMSRLESSTTSGGTTTGENTCSPITGDLCDTSYNRITRPSTIPLRAIICKDDPNAGKCDGGAASTIAKNGVASASKLIVCNPLLYGMKTDSGGKKHVLCVSKGANASSKCETSAGDMKSIEDLLSSNDGKQAFNEYVATLQGSCGQYLKADGNGNYTEDSSLSSKWDSAMAASGVKNTQDYKDTCMLLMKRATAIRGQGPQAPGADAQPAGTK